MLAFSYPSLTVAGTTLGDLERIRVVRWIEELPPALAGSPAGEEAPEDLPEPLRLFSRVPPPAVQQLRRVGEEAAVLTDADIASATSGARIQIRDTPPLRAADGRPVRIHYAVVFETEHAEGQLSNIASIVPLAVPLPPRELTATPDSVGVVLAWEPPGRTIFGGDPEIAGYNIYRDQPARSLLVLSAPLNETPVTETTWRDIPSYGNHSYLVTAVSTAGAQRIESDPAAIGDVAFLDKAAPLPPQNVLALVEEDTIRVVWDPVDVPDLAGYLVYRTTDRGTVRLTPTLLQETTFLDTRLEPFVLYVYSVSAVDANGNETAPTSGDQVFSPRQ
ncbi:MAG TPA: hypothetical protein VM557_13025 [Thermoanaerobaculia bacterium]|nr:hypothetical protein [Thermoanaerobaculia bacterium]